MMNILRITHYYHRMLRSNTGTSCHYRHVDLNALKGSEDTNRQAAELLRAQLSGKSTTESTKEEELTSEQFDHKLKEVLFEKSIVEDVRDNVKFGQAGWKTRYYESKFGERARKDLNRLQRDMAQSYVEGLQWVRYENYKSFFLIFPIHITRISLTLKYTTKESH